MTKRKCVINDGTKLSSDHWWILFTIFWSASSTFSPAFVSIVLKLVYEHVLTFWSHSADRAGPVHPGAPRERTLHPRPGASHRQAGRSRQEARLARGNQGGTHRLLHQLVLRGHGPLRQHHQGGENHNILYFILPPIVNQITCTPLHRVNIRSTQAKHCLKWH